MLKCNYMSDGQQEMEDDLTATDHRLRMINTIASSPISDPDNPDIDAEMDAREQTDQELVAQFNSLIRKAKSLDPKQKFLWQRVFKNALDDRRVASVLMMDLYINTVQAPDKHVMHGDLLSKYMERMEKANAQIIKLSEMVQKSIDNAPKEDSDDGLVGQDIYDVLEKNLGKPVAETVKQKPKQRQ